MTNDFLPIATFNILIFSMLHTPKSHFFASFFPERSFFTVTKSVQIGLFRASIVHFARGVTFGKSDTLKSVYFCDTKKLFFTNKHWGSEPILTFRNATNLHKIWQPLHRVVTLHSQTC